MLERPGFYGESTQTLYSEGSEGQGPCESSSHSGLPGAFPSGGRVATYLTGEGTGAASVRGGPGQILTDTETGVSGDMLN